jgi:hypothetical protein
MSLATQPTSSGPASPPPSGEIGDGAPSVEICIGIGAEEPAPKKRKGPLLASDALREDLAPLEPMKRRARVVLVASSGLLALTSAGLFLLATRTDDLRSALEASVAALVALVLGLVALTYRARAHGAMALGAALLLAALLGRGPAWGLLAWPSTSFPWELARVLAATLLPAALVFRSHYRAYPFARILLGWGLALALPFVIRCGWVVLFASSLAERASAAFTIASVLLALVGFMGSSTTAMGSVWAASTVISLALDVAVRSIDGGDPLPPTFSALGFLASATLASFGLFLSLAARFAPDARRSVDEQRRRHGVGSEL